MRSILSKIQWPFFFFVLIFGSLNGIRILKFDSSIETPLDQRQPFFAGRLYQNSSNPYNDEKLKDEWALESKAHNFTYSKLPGGPENYMLYPPFVISFYSFFSQLNWQTWGLISYALVLFCIVLVGLIAYKLYDKKGLLIFLGFLITYKGFVPALLLAQPLWFALVFIGAALYFKDKNIIIGALFLALSAIKPSIAFPLFIFFLAYRPKLFLIGSSFLVLLNIPFLLKYKMESLGILGNWFQNMKLQTEIVKYGEFDFLASNLIDSSAWFNKLGLPLILQSVFLLVLSMLIGYFLFRKKLDPDYAFLLLCLVGLFFSYHLFYDALLLLFCLPALRKIDWWRATPLLLLFLPSNFWFEFNLQIWLMLASLFFIALQAPSFRKLESV